MLEYFSISGFALCYAPLALMIIGFITFAGITDAHARRSYLRNMDTRPEHERGDESSAVTQPIRAETPAGMGVTLTSGQGATS